LKFQGKYDAAYDALYKATWSSGLHTAGYYNLAEIDCIRGDFETALKHINRSVAANAWNTKALNLKSAVLRRLGRFKDAAQVASNTLTFDPLNFWAGHELYLAKNAVGLKKEAAEAMNTLKVKSRREVQSYPAMAVDYVNCGLWDEAIQCLHLLVDSSAMNNNPSDALAPYYLGNLLYDNQL